MTTPRTVFLLNARSGDDPVGSSLEKGAGKHLGIKTGAVRTGTLVYLYLDISSGDLERFAREGLADRILHSLSLNDVPELSGFGSWLIVHKRPGVTDDEGLSAQEALHDVTGIRVEGRQRVFTSKVFYIHNTLAAADLERLADELIGNPLITTSRCGSGKPDAGFNHLHEGESSDAVSMVSLDLPDAGLQTLSKEGCLSLNLEEMHAVRDYFLSPEQKKKRVERGFPAEATDCELEIIAQTWSEHCKHKEFNAEITFTNHVTGTTEKISSLFKTYIRGSTMRIMERLAKASPNHWLVKVFSDNAGVVKIDDERLFIWKVETHNSPSALDPYGGAITGILGNNRDALGTGHGGAKCLFNTNVLCFGDPEYTGKLYPGQLHPRRIMEGVIHGIEDGGNKSGIPTVNGSIVFDDRYLGKPLVYCGTGAVMPAYYTGQDGKKHPSWEKPIELGDRIVMVGGRVGNDGIHGATFSSMELDKDSPRSAVQIGSPITQKKLADFLEVATQTLLVRSCTDNGAGGLSSSIGELAQTTGGAVLDLSLVPLKYPGLRPWEIFLSESQERMSLAVDPANMKALQELAQEYDVEISNIGEFTDSGFLDLYYGKKPVASLEMHFLHEGVPQKYLQAEWTAFEGAEPSIPRKDDYTQTLLDLLSSLNICSRESVIRRYDHEVKGKSVVKPLMGRRGNAPQDAAVVRVDFSGWQGIAVSNGIVPRYGDIDPYAMSACAFDEAVRQIIAVGGRLPEDNPQGPFWSVNDNFCVPDSVYDPKNNSDGRLKLGKLVLMCQALADMAETFGIPMTSGKDSMKNDFRYGDVKISVPPTVLYSMAAKIDDVRTVVTSEFKSPGHAVFLLGRTRRELGAGEYYRLHGELGAIAPKVYPEEALSLYRLMGKAHDKHLFASCHDLSDGGLAVSLAESCFGSGFGADITLPSGDSEMYLFSESPSRFLVSVEASRAAELGSLFGDRAVYLGTVTTGDLTIAADSKRLVSVPVSRLAEAWSSGLEL